MTVIIFEHSHFSCYFRTQLTALIATLYFLTKARQSGNATGFYWKILVRLLIIFLLAL